MNKFGFIIENIAPFDTKQGSTLFKDCLLTQNEKRSLFKNQASFGVSKKQKYASFSKKQKAHYSKVKRVGALRKKHGFTLQQAWDVVKRKKTIAQVKKERKSK